MFSDCTGAGACAAPNCCGWRNCWGMLYVNPSGVAILNYRSVRGCVSWVGVLVDPVTSLNGSTGRLWSIGEHLVVDLVVLVVHRSVYECVCSQLSKIG